MTSSPPKTRPLGCLVALAGALVGLVLLMAGLLGATTGLLLETTVRLQTLRAERAAECVPREDDGSRAPD